MADKPYEVVGQPFDLWLAPVGTVFPKVDTAPTGAWAKLGTSASLNYDESGVVITHEQKVDLWRALGSTGARKAFRSEESLTVQIKLADVSPDQYKNAINGNTVTSTSPGAGVPGSRK